jgi:hypothetical protein
MRSWFAAVSCLCLVCPATAKEEPFGQETVEVRPWRNPPRAGGKPAHRHSHAGHSHKPHAHAKGHRHAHPHDRAHKDGAHEAHGHPAGDGHHHHGIDTEHLFGFTTGTDIDPPGAKHFIADLNGRFAKGSGSYAAFSQRFEYAFTPWRDFHVGLSASLAGHAISGVMGLDDRRAATFEGVGVEFRQRLLDRATAPFGLAVIAEPHVARVEEGSGEAADKVAVEFTIAADKELIKDKLFGAINLVYEPEWIRLKATGETERESTVGASFAAMAQIAPSTFLGGELRYLRKYEGARLNTFAGEALFLGPSLFINLGDHLSLIAAWSSLVAGRPAGTSAALDLENFERHRAKLKAVFNF